MSKNNQQPLVSIIVPTYNSSVYLFQCLESIKNQTYKNIEIIVVDNNSTDKTKVIANNFTKFVYNRGPERSAQVNYGVEMANGEYVYKVDSDFVLDPNVVRECVDEIAKGYDAIVVHNSPDTRVGWIARIRKFEVDMYKYDILHSSARFVKKDIYLKIGGFNEKITAGEDYDFQNKINRAGYKTSFIEAEALHLGEPRKLWPHLKKYYIYGKDFINYKKYNVKESKKQLGFFRGVYIRNWRKFIIHPIKGILFLGYTTLKFTAGGLGMLSSRKIIGEVKVINSPNLDNNYNYLVSIIVPTYNSSQTLENCLRSISNQNYKNIELIVVDNNSSDITKKIAKSFTKKVYNRGPERSSQRNFGASKSSGDIVVFIDSDMILKPNVISQCVSEFSDKEVMGVIIPEESFGEGFWAQCKKLERSFYVGVDWIEAARCFRSNVFSKSGGYNEDLISGEDWDLSLRILEHGKNVRISEFILHDEGHLKLLKTLSKKYYYSKNIKRYLKQNKNNASRILSKQKNPFSRYTLYFSKPKMLLSRPVLSMGMLFMKTAEFAAGGVGYIFSKDKLKK